jgi:hypothetical protein
MAYAETIRHKPALQLQTSNTTAKTEPTRLIHSTAKP